MIRFVLPAAMLCLATPLAAQQPPIQTVPLPPSTATGEDYGTPQSPASESRERLGRDIGTMTTAARRAAAQARVAAEGAMRDFRRGFDEGEERDRAASSEYEDGWPIRYEEEAVDACAAAAEDEGLSMARLASVRYITRVDPRRDGWMVTGTIELRDSYRDRREPPLRFRCTVRGGDIADVRISESYARR